MGQEGSGGGTKVKKLKKQRKNKPMAPKPRKLQVSKQRKPKARKQKALSKVGGVEDGDLRRRSKASRGKDSSRSIKQKTRSVSNSRS